MLSDNELANYIRQHTVKVCGGSGVLVKTYSREYMYVFTVAHVFAKHDEEIEIQREVYDKESHSLRFEKLEIKGEPIIDKDNDAAVIKVCFKDDVELLPIGNHNECANARINHGGYPESRADNEDMKFALWSVRRIEGDSVNNGVCYLYKDFQGKKQLEGMSGGGLFADATLLGLHKKQTQKDEKEQQGSAIMTPVCCLINLLQANGLYPVLDFDPYTNDDIAASCFSINAIKPKADDINGILNVISKLKSEMGMPSPKELMEVFIEKNKFKENLMQEAGKNFWICLNEYALGMLVLYKKEVNIKNLCDNINKYRLVYFDKNHKVDFWDVRKAIGEEFMYDISEIKYVVVGGLDSCEYDYDVLPPEKEVPNVAYAQNDKNSFCGIDISDARSQFSRMTFVNNCIFVDAIKDKAPLYKGKKEGNALSQYKELLETKINAK